MRAIAFAMIAACAPRVAAPALVNRAAPEPAHLTWRATIVREGVISITLAVDGNVVLRDVANSDSCREGTERSGAVYFACDGLVSWDAELAGGTIVVTRADTWLDQGTRRRIAARIPSAATSLLLGQNGMSSSGPPPPPPPPPPP